MISNGAEDLRALTPGRLYLWSARTGDNQNASALQSILSLEEQKRALRFRRAGDSHQFILAHALVRLALCHHFDVPPGEWQFDRGRNGKPAIAAPEMLPAIQVSLSHTDGLVACLITLSIEAAVDVEKIEYSRDLKSVARRIFSPADLTTLAMLSGKEWTACFFDHWTIKEAIAKARGLGLALSFSDISLERGAGNWVCADFASVMNDDPSTWILWRDLPQSQHAMSVAVKRDFDGECEIIHRSVKFDGTKIIPLTQAHYTEPSRCIKIQSLRGVGT